jgi:PPM family protein phosphatase
VVAEFLVARIVEAYQSELQDRAEVIETGPGLVIVVADGAGGRAGAARAAEVVVQMTRQAVSAIPARKIGDPRTWSRLLAEMDQALLDDPAAGETTAVVAALSAAGIAGASVGDSGAWLITPKGYDELTERQHPKPFLGTGAAIPIPFSARRFDGTLLMASDGLFKYTSPESICEVALEAEIEETAKRLVDLVRLRSGGLPDDISVVLCRPSARVSR